MQLGYLDMNDQDLSKYLTCVESIIDGLKIMLVNDDITKVLSKLDNMFMVFVFMASLKNIVWLKTRL